VSGESCGYIKNIFLCTICAVLSHLCVPKGLVRDVWKADLRRQKVSRVFGVQMCVDVFDTQLFAALGEAIHGHSSALLPCRQAHLH
jgi:hypothetical protein